MPITNSPDNGGPAQSEPIANNYPARDCSKPMGWTSENVGADFDLKREDMDDFAAKSYQKAERAQKAGYFDREIVPFNAYKKDASGVREKVVITKDDGIRYGTTKEGLSKIRSAFPQWGKALTTGGNASQITDGAAAVLLMTRRKAEELGLKILAKHISTAVTGVAPRVMGIGPVSAIRLLLKNVGLSQDVVDLWEVCVLFKMYCHRSLTLIGLDQRSIRNSMCVQRQGAWHRPRKSQRQRRCHSAWTSLGLHRCQADRNRSERARAKKGQGKLI